MSPEGLGGEIRFVFCHYGAKALQWRRFYGVRKNRVRGGSGQEKAKYGAPRAPERAPFKGRVEGSSPHPPLEDKGEGRGAYFVLSSDVLEWYVFLDYLVSLVCI
jgi:hypothetical protein